MIRLASIVAALGFPAFADAVPDRLSILLGSHHFDAQMEFEEANPGLFLTWEDRAGGRMDLSLGAYRNSYGATSVAAFAALPLATWDGGDLAAFAGVARYPGQGEKFAVHLGGDWVPLGGLQVRHGHLFAQLIPSDGVWTDAIVAVGVTFEVRP